VKNAPALLALGALAVLALRGKTMQPTRGLQPDDPKFAPMRAVITAAARRHGVPDQIALAFAWLESRFNPNAEGDLKWAEWDQGARYKRYVLDNPKLATNPARDDPSAWHSYGLFQLLAPHFVQPNEHPRALLNPTVNADRGCRYLATALRKSGGDPVVARLYYAGAAKLAEDKQRPVIAAITRALRLFPGDVA
jgi:soluble lytic murein transglycosylase-like protein